MPRPRAFDEADILDRAIRVFWARGYAATSTEALCAATGLSRGSLYNAFESKAELFRRALDRYMSLNTDAIRVVLDGPAPGGEKVRALLWRAVEPDPADPSGCLVVHSMIEFWQPEDPVAAALREDQETRRRALRAAIADGQRDGSIRSSRSAQDLAEFVMAVVSGVRVAARAGVDIAGRRKIATTALDVL